MKHLLLLVLLLSLCSPARADYLGSWKIDDALTFSAQTSSSTGAATDADSSPTYRVYEDETGTAIINGTMATLDASNTDGFYSEQITLSAANGLEKGKSYTIRIAATVGGVTGATTHNFQVEAEVDANTVSPTVAASVVDVSGNSAAADNLEDFAVNCYQAVDDKVGTIAYCDAVGLVDNNAISASSITNNSITADKIANGAIDAGTFASGAIDNAAVNLTETLNANVTQWLATAVKTPYIAGVPMVQPASPIDGQHRITWVVDDTDAGDADLGTYSDPFDTIAAAIAAASPGDAIYVRAGTYATSSQLDTTTKSGLLIYGDGSGTQVNFTTATHYQGVFVVGSNTRLTRMSLANVDKGSCVVSNDHANVEVDHCTLVGHDDAVLFNNVSGARVHDNVCTSRWDGITVKGSSRGGLIANNQIVCTSAETTEATYDGYQGIYCDGFSGVVKENTVTISKDLANAWHVFGIKINGVEDFDPPTSPGLILLDNVVDVQVRGGTGMAVGIGDTTVSSPQNGHRFLVRGGTMSVENTAVPANEADVRLVVTGSSAKVENVIGVTAARCVGTVEVITPPNFGALAINSSGHVSRVTLTDTATALTEDVSGTVSPFLVSKEHTWRFDRASQVTAPQLIQEASGFDDLLLEMDFSGAMSANASISSIDSVTITDETGKTEPTVVSSALSADRKKVHITTDGASATAFSSGYTYNVTVTTTDSQTLVRKGRLVVQ